MGVLLKESESCLFPSRQARLTGRSQQSANWGWALTRHQICQGFSAPGRATSECLSYEPPSPWYFAIAARTGEDVFNIRDYADVRICGLLHRARRRSNPQWVTAEPAWNEWPFHSKNEQWEKGDLKLEGWVCALTLHLISWVTLGDSFFSTWRQFLMSGMELFILLPMSVCICIGRCLEGFTNVNMLDLGIGWLFPLFSGVITNI